MGFVASSASAQMAQSQYCSPYFDAVGAGKPGAPAVVPDRLLLDTDLAVRCLVAVVGAINSEIGQNGMAPETSTKLWGATDAIRTLMTAPSSNAEGSVASALPIFVDRFRKYAGADLNVASALTYGMRDDNNYLRINSVLIMSNVVDDATVCVPLIHLNDPKLIDSTSGVHARANLLGVVNVVAPYTSRDNFDNTRTTLHFIRSVLDQGDPNLAATNRIIANMSARLDAQTDNSNRSVPMPETQRKRCKEYLDNYTKSGHTVRDIQY